jgi:hypothetical protein
MKIRHVLAGVASSDAVSGYSPMPRRSQGQGGLSIQQRR